MHTRKIRLRIRLKSRPVFMLVALLSVFMCTGCGKMSEAEGRKGAPGEPPVAVEGLTVSSGYLVPEIRGSGVVKGRNEAWVVSEVSGLVQQVNYSLGDRVPKGYTLLSVDASLAEKGRSLARQRYRTAKLEYEAAERANKGGSMSALEFSRIADRMLAAEASRGTAEKAYDNCFLTAPFDGVVALRDEKIGIGTYLSPGMRIVRIVDDSSFRTEISIGEGQVLLIREGAPALITSRDGAEYAGKVAAVSAGSARGTGSYIVVVEWASRADELLRSGMTVDVAIEASGAEPRVIIPSSAVRMRGERAYVFVAKDGRAFSREVLAGSTLGGRLEVLKGLEDGEILISSGLASLSEGRDVNVTLMGSTGDSQ